jgi:hypothetical protein
VTNDTWSEPACGPYYLRWVGMVRPRTQEVCEMQNSTRYGRWTWKKWVVIYAIAAAIVYAIVYLLFFAHGGGGGGGGLY